MMIILKPKRTAISLNIDAVCIISSSGSSGKETYGDEFSHCEFKPHCCYEENALKNVNFFSTIAKRHGILETIKNQGTFY